MTAGIDYAGTNGTCNRDEKTGIRYGIISMHCLADWAYDEFESHYWQGCGNCGTELTSDEWQESDDSDAVCPNCGEDCTDHQFADEPSGYTYEAHGLSMSIDSSGDVWVYMSPLVIRAAFCSPCAPGACHLESPCDDGAECYAVPRDWFDDERAPCPYPTKESVVQ